MELHQVEAIGGQVAQAVFHETREVLSVVAFGGVRREAAPGLGGDHDFLFALALQLRDQPLAAAHAVDIGGVDEVDAAIDGLVQRGQRFVVANVSPCAANGPCAKTDFRNLPAGPSQRSISSYFQLCMERGWQGESACPTLNRSYGSVKRIELKTMLACAVDGVSVYYPSSLLHRVEV